MVRDDSPSPIRVVVVDDHPLFRQGVAQTLDAEPGMQVVDQGASADDALRLVRMHVPDVVLLDVTMPGGGLSAAAAIATTCPATKIAVLTVSEHEDDVTAALKAGARGYILKGVSARELVEVVRAVAGGEGYISPGLAASVLAQMARGDETSSHSGGAGGTGGAGGAGGEQHAALGGRNGADTGDGWQSAGSAALRGEARLIEELTDRERQILERVASGDSNKEIAYALHLSEKTVKHYMTSILQKLQARNRVEAALMAQRSLAPAS
jgi:DNA-binding NarL/FixJ family response regulator